MSRGTLLCLWPVLQVDELRSAGASEAQRRRSLEVMLKQAASLFRKELACKSDEVAALQVRSHRRSQESWHPKW
jgi:hypothetical protein